LKSEMDIRGSVTSLPGRNTSEEAGLHALHQAANRLADARRGAPKFRTKELVGLLLSHGARTWRNSMPRTDMRLRVCAPSGKQAVRLRIGG
jgi:hypothetical protein